MKGRRLVAVPGIQDACILNGRFLPRRGQRILAIALYVAFVLVLLT